VPTHVVLRLLAQDFKLTKYYVVFRVSRQTCTTLITFAHVVLRLPAQDLYSPCPDSYRDRQAKSIVPLS